MDIQCSRNIVLVLFAVFFTLSGAVPLDIKNDHGTQVGRILQAIESIETEELRNAIENSQLDRSSKRFLRNILNKLSERDELADERTGKYIHNRHTIDADRRIKEAMEDQIGDLVRRLEAAEILQVEEDPETLGSAYKSGWWWCDWCGGTKHSDIVKLLEKLCNCNLSNMKLKLADP